MVRIWAGSTGADIIAVSKTWLSKSVPDNDIAINGFNIYRTDQPRKGGSVALFVKACLPVKILFSKSVPRQFELLALRVNMDNC